MRYVVGGLEPGTNKPLKGVIEAKDAASAKAAVAKRGWTDIRVKEAPPGDGSVPISAAAAAATPAAGSVPSPNPETQAPEAPVKPASSNVRLWILSGLAILVVVGGGIYFGMLYSASKRLQYRIESSQHMRLILSLCNLWENDHNQHFPEHLVQLADLDPWHPQYFVNPATGTSPPNFSTADLARAKADWHTMASQLDEHCDYYYYGHNTPGSPYDDVIVLCEKPHGDPDGYNVGFADCHVDFVRTKDLPAVFEKHNHQLQGMIFKPLVLINGEPPPPPS